MIDKVVGKGRTDNHTTHRLPSIVANLERRPCTPRKRVRGVLIVLEAVRENTVSTPSVTIPVVLTDTVVSGILLPNRLYHVLTTTKRLMTGFGCHYGRGKYRRGVSVAYRGVDSIVFLTDGYPSALTDDDDSVPFTTLSNASDCS